MTIRFEIVTYVGPSVTEIALLENIWRQNVRRAYLVEVMDCLIRYVPEDVAYHICCFLPCDTVVSAKALRCGTRSQTYLAEVMRGSIFF